MQEPPMQEAFVEFPIGSALKDHFEVCQSLEAGEAKRRKCEKEAPCFS